MGKPVDDIDAVIKSASTVDPLSPKWTVVAPADELETTWLTAFAAMSPVWVTSAAAACPFVAG